MRFETASNVAPKLDGATTTISGFRPSSCRSRKPMALPPAKRTLWVRVIARPSLFQSSRSTTRGHESPGSLSFVPSLSLCPRTSSFSGTVVPRQLEASSHVDRERAVAGAFVALNADFAVFVVDMDSAAGAAALGVDNLHFVAAGGWPGDVDLMRARAGRRR